MNRVDFMLAADDIQQHNEHYDAHTVIEQRLAGNLGLQALGGVGVFENTEDRNGICGRDKSAKQQAVDKREIQTQAAKENPGQRGHDEGRGQDACGGQGTDDPFLLQQVAQVDM